MGLKMEGSNFVDIEIWHSRASSLKYHFIFFIREVEYFCVSDIIPRLILVAVLKRNKCELKGRSTMSFQNLTFA